MLRYIFPILFLMSFTSASLDAQTYSEPRRTSSTRVQGANLQQDVRELKELVGELRLAIESLQRENESLQIRLSRAESQLDQSKYVTQQALARELASLQAQVNSQNLKQQEVLVKELTELIQQTVGQAAVSSNSSVSTPEPEPVTFDENYPKNGVMYQVKPGDTISKIAQQLGSTIKYIQNANKIADPKKLQVGDTLFIPVPNTNP